MKLGVFTVLFQDLMFEDMLDRVKAYGIDAIEIGTGGYPGDAHCPVELLLSDEQSRKKYLSAIQQRGLTISALSCHGNPLHPNKQTAQGYHDSWRKTVMLASKLEVETVIGFSGCPGDSPLSKSPNWVTCAWPPDYLETLDWQWQEVAIPYWKEEEEFARSLGVKIALEMHPGFLVYNPETCLKLREQTGPNIGANLDPSHLFWQGIDAAEAVRILGQKEALFYFHAKDTSISKRNVAQNGVLDTKSYTDWLNRSWTFRSVGWGHDTSVWKEIISSLRMVGYDKVISIEHEDGLASTHEGLSKSVGFLKEIILTEDPTDAWWV